MIKYRIDGKDFYNPYLAFLHGAHHSPHETPIFTFHDEVFDKIDWKEEPSESLTELMDSRVRQLSQKYKRIVLAFSGGTDSITVYNSFVRQNIFIDEIIITFTPKSEIHSIKNVSWLMKNHNDKRTKITVWNRTQSEYYTVFDDQEWVLQNYGQFRRFELGAPGPYFYRHCHDSWGNENWCMVIGYEKPHILRENNNWFAVHLDKVFHHAINWPRLEFFFITPDLPKLHIKQNHSLLKYVKKKFSNSPGGCPEGWSSVLFTKGSHAEYVEYAEACGCDNEVRPGQGWIQKQNNRKVIKDISSLMNNKFDNMIGIDPLLQEKLLQKDKTAVSFIQGWQALQNDKTLINYMLRQRLLHTPDQTVENYNGMWGKKYLLE